MTKFEVLLRQLAAGDGYTWLGVIVAVVIGWALVEWLSRKGKHESAGSDN